VLSDSEAEAAAQTGSLPDGSIVRLLPARHAALAPEQLGEAAALLDATWPGIGGPAARRRQLEASAGGFLLLRLAACGGLRAAAVVGHCRLRLAPESSSDAAAGQNGVVTSIVVAPAHRRSGCGAAMLRLLERAAEAAGYCYLYLWAEPGSEPGVAFARGLGYAECGKAAEAGCLQALAPAAKAGLEAMLAGMVAGQA
jgi:ribosomal protein S18 acetylase RimI-like enzyme